MSDWLDAYPILAPLRASQLGAGLGLRWLDDQSQAEQDRTALLDTYTGDTWSMGVLWIRGLWEACGEDAAQRLRVADGPSQQRLNGVELAGGLYIDTRIPNRLFYTPSKAIPPALWVEVEPDEQRLAALLAEYHPTQPPARDDLPAVLRAFAGRLRYLYVPSPYSGQLEHAGPHELSRHLVFSPFVEATGWGSAYADNPWPDEPLPPLQQGLLGRRMLQQAQGAVCKVVRRTLFSRAHFGLEFHSAGRYVWELRYRPSAFPATVRRFNQRFNTVFDEDLPIDLVGPLLGFDYATPAHIHEQIVDHERRGLPGGVAYWLANLFAVEHANLELAEFLRRFMRSDSHAIKAALINCCLEYNWRFLVEDLAFQEHDPDLLAFFDRRLSSSFQPFPVNDLGEPDDLWEDVPDEQADDDAQDEEDA